MHITEIIAYQVDLPLHEGSYKWSGGNSVSVFDSTIVAVKTNTELVGYGEICPLGAAYLPAYAAGARTGIAELSPHLIGLDPTQLGVLNHRMDQAMRGHPYVKSAIDMACWDLLGKACGQPVVTLLGGRYGDRLRRLEAAKVFWSVSFAVMLDSEFEDQRPKINDYPFNETATCSRTHDQTVAHSR